MDLNQLFHDLDKPRTHKEMEEYFHQIYSITEQSKELTELARLKTSRYKKFLEEFPSFQNAHILYLPVNVIHRNSYIQSSRSVAVVDVAFVVFYLFMFSLVYDYQHI